MQQQATFKTANKAFVGAFRKALQHQNDHVHSLQPNQVD